ncbi:restriction endonuclease [Virgibacillus dokdonensis]|uniref:Restriction endonuclease n=1 Tax=Virgibacillus dokdonensis TaxID=302167 RepID=A0ABU7VJD4_9BACI
MFYKQFLKWKVTKRMAQLGIKDIDRMDGFQFEAYLKVLFKKLGYCPLVTQKSGDYGADVILQGKNKVVIQSKRYGYKNRVSMDAVREVYAAQAFYQADEAWVITNSFYTKQAKELAKACGVKLLNRYELEQFIIKINPEQSPKEVLRKKAFIK